MNISMMIKSWQWITYHYRDIAFTLIITSTFISLSWQITVFTKTFREMTPNTLASSSSTSTASTFKITDFLPIFGVADEKNSNQFIPKTSLNLKLKGVLSSKNNELSSAIIQGGDGVDRLYKQGDKLPGGAILDQVQAHYVIIQYQGTLQKIMFPENKEKVPLRQSSQLPTTQVMHSLKQQQEDARQLEQRIDILRNKFHPPGN